MKRMVMLFVLATSFEITHAQVDFGLKGGLNLSAISGDNMEETSIKTGFHVGAFAKLGLVKKLFLNPEIVYSGQGAKTRGDGFEADLNLHYLNIPVAVRYDIAYGFFAETGPQLGILTSARARYENYDADIKNSFKKLDFSWTFGGGYQTLRHVGVNVRYNLGLSKIRDNGNAQNSVFQLSAVYLFGNYQ